MNDKKDKKITKKPAPGEFITAKDKSSTSFGLYYPIGANGEIDVITLRRPIVEDALRAERASDGSMLGSAIAKAAFCSEMFQSEMEELDTIEDFDTLSRAYHSLRTNEDRKTFEDNDMIELADDKLSVRIKLYHPVKDNNGKTIKELIMKRPRLKHTKIIDKDDNLKSRVKMFAELCDVSPNIIKKLDDLDDWTSVDDAFETFREAASNK